MSRSHRSLMQQSAGRNARPVTEGVGKAYNTGTRRSLQREHNGAAVSADATALVQTTLAAPGRPLDSVTRSEMEPHIGYDLSTVRVHDDAGAARSAGAIGAHAYTTGRHIVFGDGRYAPRSSGGRSLLAHELTHVAQQAQGPVGGVPIGDGFTLSSPDDSFERSAAAKAAASAAAGGGQDAWNGALEPLTASQADSASRSLQRSATDDWTIAGGVAGAIGAALGATALIFAILAWRRPANAAPTVGGISINNPGITAVPDGAMPQRGQDGAVAATTRREKILDLRTDGDNHADINLAVATDGVSIFSATPEIDPIGYRGGTGGSSAVINMPTSTVLARPTYAPDATPAATSPAPRTAGRGRAAAPTPTPAPAPTPAATGFRTGDTAGVVQVAFSGTNSVGEGDPQQQFGGRFVIRANPASGHNVVECVECVPTNHVGFASRDDRFIGHVDYHGQAAAPATGATQSPAPPTSTTPAPRAAPPTTPAAPHG